MTALHDRVANLVGSQERYKPMNMKPDPNSLGIAKALDRQDEFDSVMAWLRKMVSACNELELNFQGFLSGVRYRVLGSQTPMPVECAIVMTRIPPHPCRGIAVGAARRRPQS